MEQARIEPNVYTFTAIADAHAKVYDTEGVASVLEQMLERGLSPNQVTLRAALRCIEEGSESSHLRDLVNKSKSPTKFIVLCQNIIELLRQEV
mmetsp:Transcript_17140/g.69383  ORF Transcript_17140/g.69383 Transcript_17140/m.69383 type:complete len:93 (+) Transcript_17140:1777-2055(+)